MLPVLNKVVNVYPSGWIMIESEDHSSHAFLILHFINEAVSSKSKVIVLTAARSEKTYKLIASKMLVRLSGQVSFIPISSFLDDTFNKCSTLILSKLEQAVLSTLEGSDKVVYLIVDNVTLLCDITHKPLDLVNFLRRLRNLMSFRAVNSIMVLVFPSHCEALTPCERVSDFVLRTKHIGTGFAKDVTGQLVIFDRRKTITPSEHAFHYYLGDKSIRLYPPGFSKPSM